MIAHQVLPEYLNGPPVLEIPTLRTTDGPSVSIQPADVGGSRLFAVAIRDRGGHRRDRWFGLECEALAHAVEQADGLGLMLLDLREPEVG